MKSEMDEFYAETQAEVGASILLLIGNLQAQGYDSDLILERLCIFGHDLVSMYPERSLEFVQLINENMNKTLRGK